MKSESLNVKYFFVEKSHNLFIQHTFFEMITSKQQNYAEWKLDGRPININ